MFVVVCYDIQDDKRRRLISGVLEEVGTRVQESVFECLVNPTELEELRRRVTSLLELPGDRVRYYPVCPRCLAKAKEQGGPPLYTEPLAYFA